MKRIACITLAWLALMMSAEEATASDVLVATHTLNTEQQKTLNAWLKKHTNLQIKTIEECGCDREIEALRKGSATDTPEPDYNPYLVVGDFRGNGQVDFAIVLNDLSRRENNYLDYEVLVVFNGPFHGKDKSPAFIQNNMEMADYALFFSPQAKRFGIGIAQFNADIAIHLIPTHNTYKFEQHEQGD
jgi:hypothetical protein